MIAGTHSSAGKTTWSLALMSFFRRKGLTVQPFKVGPDYIDPGFHHRACRPRKSRNLDRFFLPENYLRQCFLKNSEGADLALIEGVMGLFDGRSALSQEGSTAEMAKLLQLPVFLVVDGSGLARSAAAVVKGFHDFDPKLRLAGVFLNQLGSEGHFAWLRESIEKETGVPALGWLPKDEGISIPERPLGLRTVLEEKEIEEKLDRLGKILEGNFDEKKFLELSKNVIASPARGGLAMTEQCPRMGVAYDKAFSFYYEDNFDLLREGGGELVFFSPLRDEALPADLDALYLGGGFPEIYAAELAGNESMKNSVQNFHREGKIIYAECGGLIYLNEIGLVPGKIQMTRRLQNFGYHEIEAVTSTFLFKKGTTLRSHEFHYSAWESGSDPFSPVYRIQNRLDGFYDGHLLATYQHLHFGQAPELARNFIEAALTSRKSLAGSNEKV